MDVYQNSLKVRFVSKSRVVQTLKFFMLLSNQCHPLDFHHQQGLSGGQAIQPLIINSSGETSVEGYNLEPPLSNLILQKAAANPRSMAKINGKLADLPFDKDKGIFELQIGRCAV